MNFGVFGGKKGRRIGPIVYGIDDSIGYGIDDQCTALTLLLPPGC